jgi:hypothetical protein
MTDTLALQCISTLAVVAAAVIVAWQVIEMRRGSQAQAFGVAREILQEEYVREARDTVFKQDLENKPIDEWSESEKKQVGIVCHTYDSVWLMVRYKFLNKEAIVDSWGPSIIRLWPIVEPLVKKIS